MITKTTNPELGWVYFDSKGVRMPWYTLPCLEWMDKLDFKLLDVFEYGLGHSTEWFLSRGAGCCGVESSIDWARQGFKLFQDKEAYTKSILSEKLDFDIIVIDGIHRDDCTEFALQKLKKGGYLICDNFEQPSVQAEWPKTRELTKNLPLTLYKQPDHYDWQTAVWQNI